MLRLKIFSGVIISVILCIAKMCAAGKQAVSFQAAALEKVNPEYIGPGAYFRLARKTPSGAHVINGMFPFIRDLPMDANVTYQVFQKINNAWKSTVVKGSSRLCEILESKNKLQRMQFEASNFPKRCPVKKGNYTVTDWAVNSDITPTVMAGTVWKARTVWGNKKALIMIYTMEMKVHYPGDEDSD